ncbi:hypothetical protein [Emticicia sp. TH156]|uniref:hypothetical protein n=1 Tax=Emticicia sp. TH156 TaxID=2067454 RepID=UPI000C765799|nr:hypothetical protein [Emticicia sp. TH156]PLK43539.1 hypothetical protein C0V77_16710 [Emticicia sp. TH156]
MSAAEGFYEVYKALPKKVQQEVRQLIEDEAKGNIRVPLEAMKEGLKEIKLIKEGKLPRKTFADFKKELANGE